MKAGRTETKRWVAVHRRLRSALGGLGDQRGVMLLEVVLATLIFSVIGLAVLSGMQTMSKSGAKTEVHAQFENIARNQMEDSFDEPYQPPPCTYPSISVPSGYTVTSVCEEYVAGDPNIEKIIVTVTYSGSPDYVLEALRTK